jgi:hypothetical protein
MKSPSAEYWFGFAALAPRPSSTVPTYCFPVGSGRAHAPPELELEPDDELDPELDPLELPLLLLVVVPLEDDELDALAVQLPFIW